MAAKGGVWTKKGFMKAADRKDNGGTVAVADDDDPATRLTSEIDSLLKASDKAWEMRRKLYTEKNNTYILSLIEEGRTGDEAIIVKGKDGTTEAIATFNYHWDRIDIKLLATHPKNMDPNHPDRIRGSGTQAMARAAKIAVDEGKDLTLESLDSARDFYEKLGFEADSKKPSEPGLIPYRLSGSGLKDLADRAR